MTASFYHEVPVSNYPLFEFPPYDLALASRMVEVAEYYDLDLLHVHYAIPHSVSALLARQMLAARGRRLPFVTTLHGTDITLVGLDRSYLPITSYAIQESDGVTCISNWLRDETVKHFGTTRPIEVIPNFVNCNAYVPLKDEAARAEARLRLAKPDEAILMHLSNFRPVKRVVDVVKVFALVAQRAAGATGSGGRRTGPLRGRMAGARSAHQRQGSLPGQAGSGERTAAAGRSADHAERDWSRLGWWRWKLWRAGFPRSPRRWAAFQELIDDGVTGLLYPVGDVEAMAAGAVSLLKNRDRLEAMREAGRKTAQKRFCASLVVPRYVQYYEQVLGKAGNRE
jgi:glycosyltransferase involved in cell wall biosynthesis